MTNNDDPDAKNDANSHPEEVGRMADEAIREIYRQACQSDPAALSALQQMKPHEIESRWEEWLEAARGDDANTRSESPRKTGPIASPEFWRELAESNAGAEIRLSQDPNIRSCADLISAPAPVTPTPPRDNQSKANQGLDI